MRQAEIEATVPGAVPVISGWERDRPRHAWRLYSRSIRNPNGYSMTISFGCGVMGQREIGEDHPLFDEAAEAVRVKELAKWEADNSQLAIPIGVLPPQKLPPPHLRPGGTRKT